jgi:uncharacterized repeat protein (TIGR03803 family)
MSTILSTLVTFNGGNGRDSQAPLVADAAGDLFGTTVWGGASDFGTVFELVKTASGYSQTTLWSFSGTDGKAPSGGLIADAAGDLFGTTQLGGASNDGTVFELVKTAGGYTQTTLWSFSGADGQSPVAGLVADAAGDLFGTTFTGGSSGVGTVFELVKTAGGYTPTTLLNFDGDNGWSPYGALTIDAAGDLFGTTDNGGASNDGNVFELVKTAGGYTPTTLLSFDGDNGRNPVGGLLADGAGDLFGTTTQGGSLDEGTVFELVKTAGGYTPTTLANFQRSVDGTPVGGLIADAAGDLFGITGQGSASNGGTVFELVKTAGGYTLTTLQNFTGPNGKNPAGGVIADAGGDLFGTTSQGGGSFNDGTAFEITAIGVSGVGNTVSYGPGDAPVTLDFGVGVSDIYSATLQGATVSISAGLFTGDSLNFTNQNGITGSYDSGTGVLTLTGSASLAAYQTALESVSYSSSASDPSNSGANLSRTISWQITDGTLTSSPVTSTVSVGETFTLTTGIDTVAGTPGKDLIVATAGTLSKKDVIDGGAGSNTLVLSGGGAFNLVSPKTLTNIQMVIATEGAGTAKPAITLRPGLNAVVDVGTGTGVKPGATVKGAANDSSIIKLGGGTDTITLGSASETVIGRGGADTINVTPDTVGATINGGSGASVLVLTTGGTATMGANITNIHKVTLKAAATFFANTLTGLTIVGSSGDDSIFAGGHGQTLTGGLGTDMLVGAPAGFDTFADTTANLNGDTIVNFAAMGDAIDITDMKAAGAILAFSDGVLTVTNGAQQAMIALTGATPSGFVLGQDAKHHVLITPSSGGSAVHTLAQAAAAMTSGAGSSASSPPTGTQPLQPLLVAPGG